MKHLIPFFFTSLLILGCSKPGILEVSQESLLVPWADEIQRIDISSTRSWQASSNAFWCQIKTTFNPQGVSAAYVEIMCLMNKELDDRSCVVTITSGSLSRQINVTQMGYPGVRMKDTSYTISSDEQDVTIPIEHTASYDVIIDEQYARWISVVSGTKAKETTNLILRVKRNTGAERIAILSIKDREQYNSITFSIKQEKGRVNENASNCFLVNTPGTHSFEALYKGRTFESIGTPKSAKVIWESFNDNNPVSEGSFISSCSLNEASGKVDYSIDSGVDGGNAIIAVFSGENGTGELLWSWHIWYIKGYDPNASSETYTNRKIFMDRNLGALSATEKDPKANGLYYQWGRKDPFPGKAFTDGTQAISASSETTILKTFTSSSQYPTDISYSIAHPLTFICNWNESMNPDLWGGEIGLYNPCPNGWTIPKGWKSWNWNLYADNGDWSGIKSENFARFNTKVGGVYYKDNSGNNISWYPGSGRRLRGDGAIEWFGNQSFFFWSQSIEYALSGVITMIFGGSGNGSYYYDILYGDYTQDNKGAHPAHGFSVRCVKEE